MSIKLPEKIKWAIKQEFNKIIKYSGEWADNFVFSKSLIIEQIMRLFYQ